MSQDLNKILVFPKKFTLFLYFGISIGLLSFIYYAISGHADLAWSAFHVNFLFWAGVSHGGILFAAAMRITQSSWGRPMMRIFESFGSFIPIVFIFIIFLYIGGEYTLPYMTKDYVYTQKVFWLGEGFVFGRTFLMIGGLHILIYFYLYNSLRQDLAGSTLTQGFFSFLSKPLLENENNFDSKLYKLSIAIAFIYALSMSFIAFDFIMSLDTHFYSTLFGIYYFMASVLAALMLTVIISSMLTLKFNLQKVITEMQFYDCGKLMFGLSVFWLYSMYSQFLPIWYGNMPEETGFVGLRVFEDPYKTFIWAILTCVFVIPFVSLIPRTTKLVKPIIAAIASVSFLGLFLEKIWLVYPSLMHDHFHIGLEIILVTFGFLCLFLLCVTKFLSIFPVYVAKDKYLIKKLESGDQH
ncbi:MAG: hypothetical protein VX618_02095 [Thermodesulfobacteriota bacterium]|nr:hypothetical protein [Thermodesulfobacteriota bacterium]NSW96724.1 hypothetical protein [bacterium]|tara:strand:- start:12805 stop:14034 length:1230 start_codon:yes stop_codon:yes gene_type:complete